MQITTLYYYIFVYNIEKAYVQLSFGLYTMYLNTIYLTFIAV